jgi:hypothetical protein
MNLRTTVLDVSVPCFVFGLLLSFFQLGSLAVNKIAEGVPSLNHYNCAQAWL